MVANDMRTLRRKGFSRLQDALIRSFNKINIPSAKMSAFGQKRTSTERIDLSINRVLCTAMRLVLTLCFCFAFVAICTFVAAMLAGYGYDAHHPVHPGGGDDFGAGLFVVFSAAASLFISIPASFYLLRPSFRFAGRLLKCS